MFPNDELTMKSDLPNDVMTIREMCEAYDVTPRTLRFYESKELLTPIRVGTKRLFTRRDRARLALILRSKTIGATLDEIRHYLDLYGHQGEGRVQQMKFVLERTDAAIRELELKRAHIDASLAELRVINAEVRQQLERRSA